MSVANPERGAGPLRARIQRPRPTLDQLATEARSRNNFDLLRLFGALSVLFGHSFDLMRHPQPFPRLAGLSWGSLGVLIFFSISGFLVTRSWDYDPRPLAFATKRALRLMPGLFVSLLLTALVLGPIVSTLGPAAYYADPTTKGFVLSNMLLQTDYSLPGVFAHTVYPTAVNGSLWTLPLEVKAYCAVVLFGAVGLLIRWRWLMMVFAAYAAVAMYPGAVGWLPGAAQYMAVLVSIQVTAQTVLQAHAGLYIPWAAMFGPFVVGSTLYYLRRWIPITWPLCLLALAGCTAACVAGGPWPLYVWGLVVPYIVVCLAYRTHHLVRMPHELGDYSYGLYVYAFPIQQTISLAAGRMSGWALFGLAVVPTFACAMLSWHFVEGPALRLKRDVAGASAAPSPG